MSQSLNRRVGFLSHSPLVGGALAGVCYEQALGIAVAVELIQARGQVNNKFPRVDKEICHFGVRLHCVARVKPYCRLRTLA